MNNSNLKPFTGANDPRRHNGRPKGTKNLSTIVRELENENFSWDLVPTKKKASVKRIGSPWRAIVYIVLAKAIDGDIKAAEWLRKVGYGNNLEDEDRFQIRETMEPIIMTHINPRPIPQE